MTRNFRLTDVGTVPVALVRDGRGGLSVRGVVRSRLVASELRYGLPALGPAAPKFPDWKDAYSIGIALRDQQSDIVVGGKRFTHLRRTSETQILYISGVEHADFYSPRHGVEILLQNGFMREIAEDLEVPPVTHIGRSLCHLTEDPALLNLARRICPFFDAPDTLDPLQADHFIWALGIYVCAHYGDLSSRRPRVGGLTTWQERLAKDVIEMSLIGGIGLAELAAFCGLRTSQFAHAFRRTTGVAPYQWLMRARIARAKKLLVGATSSLADIALACGFADQSHLTRTFARAVGATPGLWRMALQS